MKLLHLHFLPFFASNFASAAFLGHPNSQVSLSSSSSTAAFNRRESKMTNDWARIIKPSTISQEYTTISSLRSSTTTLNLSENSNDLKSGTGAAALGKENDKSTSGRKAQKGDIVTVDFKLEGNGFVAEPLFDTHGIVSFVLGWGNYLPGLHDLVEDMKAGESVENVPIDAGWGDRNPDLVAKIEKTQAAGLDYDKINVGTELFLQSGIKCIVTEVADDHFVIDANPPLAGASYSCTLKLRQVDPAPESLEYVSEEKEDSPVLERKYEVATFGLGCFWGGELAYMRERGVVGTKVGYTQGDVPNPTYKDVCTGTTGHAEAILVVYDPTVVSYERLVKLGIERLGDSIYLLNQVSNDKGTQYRHGIYYHNDEQKEVARKILDSVGEGCMTELKPATTFYDAEEYHQQYLLKGGQSARKGIAEDIRCYG